MSTTITWYIQKLLGMLFIFIGVGILTANVAYPAVALMFHISIVCILNTIIALVGFIVLWVTLKCWKSAHETKEIYKGSYK